MKFLNKLWEIVLMLVHPYLKRINTLELDKDVLEHDLRLEKLKNARLKSRIKKN